MKLLIVIVNYKSAELTINCLRSLRTSEPERVAPDSAPAEDRADTARLYWNVIVTDNHSPDDSVTRLQSFLALSPGTPGEGWGEGDSERRSTLDTQDHPNPNPLPEYRERGPETSIQPLPTNGGFAYGNNAAIAPFLNAGSEVLRRARSSDAPPGYSEYLRPGVTDKPEFILLLNPDTIVRPGAITALLDFMEKNPKAGIVGSRLEDPDGTPQRSAFRFHSIAGEFERGIRMGFVTKLLANKMIAPPVPDTACECDWVAGASMMVRRVVFEQAGLMDEKYFMYFEEVDFCLAARRKGWQCWYVPSSRVVHLVGAVSQLSDSRKHRSRRPAYWFESRRRYFVKNHGWAYAALADLAYLLAHSIWRLRRALQRKPDTDPPRLLWDSVRHSVFLCGVKV